MATTLHEVEVTIKMKVAVTDEVRNNINEQYPKSMRDKDDQYIAESVAYAWLNPRTPQEVDYDCYFDGVANMKGLITEVEVVE
jgi:hypothetical protein